MNNLGSLHSPSGNFYTNCLNSKREHTSKVQLYAISYSHYSHGRTTELEPIGRNFEKVINVTRSSFLELIAVSDMTN